MKKRTNFLSKFKLVYRPGSPLTKAALLSVIVLSTAALITIHTAIACGESRSNALRAQAAALELENADLKQNISILGSDESIKQIAQDELDMVDPDTVSFVNGNR